MAKAPAPYTAQQYLLDDHPRTLFPMTTTSVVASKALPEIQQHLAEICDPKSSAAFLAQQRCYAAKVGHHLRRTLALDPVASLFIYDLVFSHRAKFHGKPIAVRRSFGYRFHLGRPIAPSVSYGAFRSEIREAVQKYKHALAFDVSSYFNSVYQHDLAEWFEASIAVGPHVQFGQFLRESNKGRSVDCLPQGLHPCKVIGSSFLNGIDSAVQLQSALLLRFLDDFYLFDHDEHVLIDDFVRIQQLLGERGLTVNPSKTKRDQDVLQMPPGTMDEIKIELLNIRREMLAEDYDDTTAEVEEEDEDEPLTDEQLEFLLDLLKNPDLDESDAELVLTVLKSRDEEVLEHLTDILERFPSLTRRIYSFCQHISDVTGLAALLDTFVKSAKTITEDQLFWIAKIAEDYLGATGMYPKLLLHVYKHSAATAIVQAKVLEINSLQSGFQDIREEHLKGSSDWRAWASIVGSTRMPKGKRNQMLKYVGKASRMNSIVAAAVMND